MYDPLAPHLDLFLNENGSGLDRLGETGDAVAFVPQTPVIASCTEYAARLLASFGAGVSRVAATGDHVVAGQPLLCMSGCEARAPIAAALRLLSFACGIATAAAEIVDAAFGAFPDIRLTCLRKANARVRTVVQNSLLAGGMEAASDRLLMALDMRDFVAQGGRRDDYTALRNAAGDPAVIEVWDLAEITDTVLTVADMLVLNEVTPEEVWHVRGRAFLRVPQLDIAVKGHIDASNAARYATAGAQMLITSAPLSARRADIVLKPLVPIGEFGPCA